MADPVIPVPLVRSVVAFTEGRFREVAWPQWLRKMPYANLRRNLKTAGYELLSRHVASGTLVAWVLVGLTVTPVLIPKHIDLAKFGLVWR